MKKFVSIILVLVLMLGCCSALAATTEARSGSVPVNVKKYALATNVGDDLLLWDETGAAGTSIEVSNGTGTRSLATTIVLKVEGKDAKEITATSVSAQDIRDYAGTTDEVVLVKIYTKNSTVTKNGVDSTPTEIEEKAAAEVLVMNDIKGSDPQEDKPGDLPTTGLLVSTITCDVTEAFPGDVITLTGATDASKLEAKLGTKATVTVTKTTIYAYNGTAISTLKSESGASVEATDYMENVASMQFWVIGVATIAG